ncbi:MAG: four helix bundle protein [Cyclobacteriaceae bacterium]
MRDYTKYDIWKDAINISVEVYKLTGSFPAEEKFGLTSQLRRSAVSVASNLAEGCSRTSEKDFGRFLEIALGSAFELKTQLIISNKIELLSDKLLTDSITKIDKACRQLNALRSKLSTNK